MYILSCVVNRDTFRSKYRQIACHYFIVKDMVKHGYCHPVKIHTDSNYSDCLTKRCLTDAKFEKLAHGLLEGGGSSNGNLNMYETRYGKSGTMCLNDMLII